MTLTFSVLVCHSKQKEKNKARLTFSNPNYNGSGYNEEAHKSTFFKKFKYDRSQVRMIFFTIILMSRFFKTFDACKSFQGFYLLRF